MRDEIFPRNYLERQSTSFLICLPFLDTDVTEGSRIANEVLAKRGYPLFIVKSFRKIAALGLFWQVFERDWVHLDLWDVLYGYCAIFLFTGIIMIPVGIIISFKIVIVGTSIIG